MDVTKHTIQIELEGLIKLLAQNLYADPDVFLREMIQNAHDSITKRRELARERNERDVPAGAIRIGIDREGQRLTISDNGSGLTRDEIHAFLSTIGRSGTRELKERLRAADHDRAVALIGQFGIGLLSAFIVADDVEVVTRSPLEGALRWRSHGDKHYTVEDAERETVGTTVVLTVRQEHSRYLESEKLRGIIRTYADFIGIPIYLGDGTEPANAVNAPWHRKPGSAGERRKEARAFWEERFKHETSLDVMAVDEEFVYSDSSSEGGRRTGRIQGVLGITDRHLPDVNTRGVVDLYVSRMFIAGGNREVLPPWARFIQGVVECDALTPNAARDDVVRNDALTTARDALGKVIVNHLIALAREEPRRLTEIMRWHSYHVLAMCVQDEYEDFFRAVADIVPLESDQGPMTVPEYIAKASRLPDGTHMVYFITERGSANQFYVLCAARGLRVFNTSEAFAERFLERYQQTWPAKIHLARLDVAGSDTIFEPLEEAEQQTFRDLEAAYGLIFPDLRCIARIARYKPKEVPAVLTETRDHKTRREMEDLVQNPSLPSYLRDIVGRFAAEKRDPLTLHLNADNPAVQMLAKRSTLRDDVARNALIAMYNNALMLLARAIDPESIRIMFDQYNHVIELMLSGAEERERLERDRQALRTRLEEVEATDSGTRLARCVTCFVALPFKDPIAGEIYSALEEVLEDVPFLWKVVRADERVIEQGLRKNVEKQMAEAHCFIAEVSDQNPNVMIEVGRMLAHARPILFVKRQGSLPLPADLQGELFVEFESEAEARVELLRDQIRRQEMFVTQKGEGHHLSEVLLRGIDGLSPELCRRVARSFDTCEDFLAANPEEVASRLKVGIMFIRGAQDGVRDRLKAL